LPLLGVVFGRFWAVLGGLEWQEWQMKKAQKAP
jgi:hypothetical protein